MGTRFVREASAFFVFSMRLLIWNIWAFFRKHNFHLKNFTKIVVDIFGKRK
jgi:hypothetical protein